MEGVYQFQLTVTDNDGATDNDVIQVRVNPAPNQAPTASAGSSKTITLPVATATLAGSGRMPDGTISTYLWTKISGPGGCSIVNALSPVTDVTGLAQGSYQFELKVTDDKGATGRDTMQIKVNASAAANIKPVANAGRDQTITLPTDSVTLSGSGTDADGKIVGYAWKQIAGPSQSEILSPNFSATIADNFVAGTYEYELTVKDDMGAMSTARCYYCGRSTEAK